MRDGRWWLLRGTALLSCGLGGAIFVIGSAALPARARLAAALLLLAGAVAWQLASRLEERPRLGASGRPGPGP